MSFRIPDVPAKRIVVVGGGFGGLQLCTTLVKNPEFQVVLIDKNNFHQFPPLIYQIATAGLQVSSIAFPFRKMFAGSKNFFYRMCELRSVHTKERYIQTSIGKLSYDYLVIATGTTTNYFGNQKLQEESMPMKTISESLGLRNALLTTFERANTTSSPEERAELLNVVIVGGGPTGVEIAGALAEMRQHVLPQDYPDLDTSLFKIHLVQGGSRLLPAMSETASAAALKYLTQMGVDVQLKAYVHDYKQHEVILRDGRSFKSQTIIWVCGVTGRRINGIDDKFYGPGNRLIVDRFNKVEGLDNVFAVGDCALMKTHVYPKGHPQMAQAAIQQGKNLGQNFLRKEHGQILKPFEYRDLGSMATIGRNKAVADIAGMNLTGFVAWFLWMGVHLMSILGVKNKISTLVDWAWSYITYDKSNRTLIAVKHPKVILERNYEISMRHWGELSLEQAAEAERLTDTALKKSNEDAALKAQADLARNALKKAERLLNEIAAEDLARAQEQQKAQAQEQEQAQALSSKVQEAMANAKSQEQAQANAQAQAQAQAKADGQAQALEQEKAQEDAQAQAQESAQAQAIASRVQETLAKAQANDQAAKVAKSATQVIVANNEVAAAEAKTNVKKASLKQVKSSKRTATKK
ncbi:NAD(P)/FAD-dependent oxidoreductase [Anaerobiospirillum sp. NML120448]|uniref:NAD(P)/FAD-dependent oxidoreductase n=1 Tax=Anaerobiospirillum sp. NML120448 TaxID=2932816 RepID=UPI001FF17BA4|nr:NAD(P)/FAD-dependent oxidoreductase [Anaerobiospirillum sp. NML120448]MCK0513890.1 NAD(P)/FAD-dependent oxidoreductase [Anaerobiospirillum sp. NML120448]